MKKYKTKEAIIVVIIIIIAVIIAMKSPSLSGQAWKSNWVDFRIDASHIRIAEEQTVVMDEQFIIENLLIPTDQVKIKLVDVDKYNKKQATFTIWYGDLEQSFKVGLYGRGRVDVDLDGRDDLEISMPEIPANDKVLILLKAL